MVAVTIVTLVCDRCGIGSDAGGHDVSEARYVARQHGWKRKRSSVDPVAWLDLCTACAQAWAVA